MNPLQLKQETFQKLTRPWRDRLLGVALRKADTSGKAEDWVQEALLRAWRGFDALDDDVAIYAWLLKILDHTIVDDIRRDHRRQQIAPVVLTEDSILLKHRCAAPGPFEQTLQQQTDLQMNGLIKSLPDEFNSVILLRDIEGLSYREISEILDIPQGTVMSRLSRGRRLLSSILIKQEKADNTKQNSTQNIGAH